MQTPILKTPKISGPNRAARRAAMRGKNQTIDLPKGFQSPITGTGAASAADDVPPRELSPDELVALMNAIPADGYTLGDAVPGMDGVPMGDALGNLGANGFDMGALGALFAQASGAGAGNDGGEPGPDGKKKDGGKKADPLSLIQLSRADEKLAEALANYYGIAGFLVSLRAPIDGAIIMAGAGDRARELVYMSTRHPGLRKVLVNLTIANVYTPVILGHAGLIFTLLAVHGYTPGRIWNDFQNIWRRPSSSARGPVSASSSAGSPPPGAPGQAPEQQSAAQSADDAARHAEQMALLNALQEQMARDGSYDSLSHAGAV